MTQKNFMSARALTMEELKFVNGGNSDQPERPDPRIIHWVTR